MGGKVAQALVSVNPVFLGPWLDALRPVRGKLTAPLATIFRDKTRPETEHTLATNILTDYASDDPDRLAELLMVADPKAYAEPLPGRRAAGQNRPCPCSRPSLPRKPRTPGTIRRSIPPGRSPMPPS